MSTSMPTALAGGRYQLGQLIGRGGMAEVHVALDTRLGRTVAVKIMRADLANDDIFLARFRREAHAVAQMNNPNIVNIYDSGEELVSSESGDAERLPYIVMEYVKGQTLRDIIKVNGALSQRDCEQVMLGVLNALDYSHRMGIIHRDIKPGNILFDERELPVLIDFGAALNKPEVTCTVTQGEFSYAYASPEQITGKGEIGPWTDLYALAATWYGLISSIPVEPADRRLMQDDVVPFPGMTLPLPCPRELLTSIDRNLRLKPQERCQAAGEWKEWLQQGKPLRTSPRLVLLTRLLIAAVVVLLVGVAAWGIWGTIQSSQPINALPKTHEAAMGKTDPASKSPKELKDALY